jgi:hypothetical protein
MQTNTKQTPDTSTSLVQYDAARHALAECVRIDEVKKIHNEFAAVAEYARRAKDTQLIRHATRIRWLAETRLGELLAKQKNKGAAGGGKKDGSRGHVLQPRDKTPTLAQLNITKTESVKFQRLAAMPADKRAEKLAHAMARAEQAATSAPRHTKSEFTGDFEHYTPAEELELARRVLGRFDLTPASNAQAQKIAKAKVYYTIDDDALKHEWYGQTFMNPPFTKSGGLIGLFVNKLVHEYQTPGHVTEAIMLTNNYTDTQWFKTAAAACSAICFTTGRVKFYDPQGEIDAPTQGQAFFYFGKHPDKFCKVFQERGTCWAPVKEKES